MVPKLQIVSDPLITDCLNELPGKSKVDKIRWALCVYRELLRDSQNLLRPDSDAYRILSQAGKRYRENR